MAEKFEDFFGHNEEAVDQAAHLLAEAEEALKVGDINQSEFDEIAEDILEIHRINELTSDVNRKATIKKMYDNLRSIVSSITLS